MNRSRFVVALAMVGFALLSYYGVREKNPITGESQHVGLSQEQEVVLGLQSAPEMADQFVGAALQGKGGVVEPAQEGRGGPLARAQLDPGEEVADLETRRLRGLRSAIQAWFAPRPESDSFHPADP